MDLKVYTAHGGTVLSWYYLAKKIKETFFEDVLIFSSPGLATILVFRPTSSNLLTLDMFNYELTNVPTTTFDDNGEMRIATSKSILKKKLEIKHSSRELRKPDVGVIDGCAIPWCIHWPWSCTLHDFINCFWHYVSQRLYTSTCKWYSIDVTSTVSRVVPERVEQVQSMELVNQIWQHRSQLSKQYWPM